MASNAGKNLRLRKRMDIQQVFEQGVRARDERMTLAGRPNGLPHSRVGTGVSTRHGGAVRRNRIKRLCREAFRLSRGELPTGWDYMIVPRLGAEFTVEGIAASLASLTSRLIEAAERKGREP